MGVRQCRLYGRRVPGSGFGLWWPVPISGGLELNQSISPYQDDASSPLSIYLAFADLVLISLSFHHNGKSAGNL